MKLGLNGLGRIGKLSLWHHVSRQHFSEVVVNLGRNVGSGLEDIAASIERDSSYGRLSMYLHGHKGGRVIENLDDTTGTMTINGVPVTILREARNPKDIDWKGNQVRLVVDTTGVFKDPTADPNEGRGAIRGHLQAGAEKVMLSAPFKIQAKGLEMPDDAITTVMGINDDDYDSSRHNVVSAASCTTTCLSYMMKPLLDHFGADRMLSASMVTVHAATGSQQVLDRMPAAGATDLRKDRSIFNNIILTTTGAAKALGLVIPEMKNIGFIAESVRIPTSTGSLIVLVLNFQDELENPIKRGLINSIYNEYAANTPYLIHSKEQNVSSDIVGMPKAAAVIESTEIHTRTASINVNLKHVKGVTFDKGEVPPVLQVPVTQSVIYGWYDNELGSYTNMLGDLTVSVAEKNGVIVRKMLPEDIAAVHFIEQEVMKTSWSENQIRSESEYVESVQLVAEVDGKVCGYIFFRWCGPEAELMRIGVASSTRKLGIGGALVDKGLSLLAGEDVEQCCLEVRSSNVSAQQFYLGKGFLNQGMRPKYYRNPVEAAVLMKKNVIKELGGGCENTSRN